MATKIFVNLPVKNLDKSMAFFAELGFGFNAQFTDDKAASMVVSEDIYVMLLKEEFFKTFTKKEVADAARFTESIICLSAESREGVDEMVSKALEAGGSPSTDKQDHGFMYGWGFQDPDGHLWEVMYMDPGFINKNQAKLSNNLNYKQW